MLGNDAIQLIVGREDLSAVAEGLTWASVDPGGFESASFNFSRKLRIPRGTDVKIIYGNSPVWEGRVNEVNRQLSAQPMTQVACQGYGARFKENGTAVILIDQDLARWRNIRDSLNADLAKFVGTPQATGESGALVYGWYSGQTLAINTAAGLYYEAPPDCFIGRVYMPWTITSVTGGNDLFLRGYTTELLAATDGANQGSTSANMASASGTLDLVMAAGLARYVSTFHFRTAASAAGNEHFVRSQPVVIGDHNISVSTDASGVPIGLASHSVIDWLIKKANTACRIGRGVIDTSEYSIPQLAYYTPVTWEQIIDDVAKFAGFHYGTWEGPNLHFRRYPGAPTCWTSVDDVDDLQVNDALDGLYNRAVINYRDASNALGSVTCTRSISVLDEAGITRTLFMDIGIGTSLTATSFGNIILAISERNASSVGSFSTKTEILASGGSKPAFLLRPGIDRLKITDLTADGDGQTEFIVKRVESSVGSDGITTSVDLGNGIDLIQTLQARLGALREPGIGLRGLPSTSSGGGSGSSSGGLAGVLSQSSLKSGPKGSGFHV